MTFSGLLHLFQWRVTVALSRFAFTLPERFWRRECFCHTAVQQRWPWVKLRTSHRPNGKLHVQHAWGCPLVLFRDVNMNCDSLIVRPSHPPFRRSPGTKAIAHTVASTAVSRRAVVVRSSIRRRRTRRPLQDIVFSALWLPHIVSQLGHHRGYLGDRKQSQMFHRFRYAK